MGREGDKAMWFGMIAVFFAAAYCVARAILDIRQRRYVWAAFGFLAAVAILTMPIPTHAVKVDIPLSG